MKEKIVVKSLQDCINVLDKITEEIKNKTINNNIDDDNKNIIFYRGHSDVNYELIPSLFRNEKWKTKIVKNINKQNKNE